MIDLKIKKRLFEIQRVKTFLFFHDVSINYDFTFILIKCEF